MSVTLWLQAMILIFITTVMITCIIVISIYRYDVKEKLRNGSRRVDDRSQATGSARKTLSGAHFTRIRSAATATRRTSSITSKKECIFEAPGQALIDFKLRSLTIGTSTHLWKLMSDPHINISCYTSADLHTTAKSGFSSIN